MTNPPYILEHLEEMAKIMSSPKVYAFLHVPVQSGSDSVLADMKREYNHEDFEHVVTYLRKNCEGISIATDIICGFPTETEKDFEDTVSLCETYKFPSLFINQFFPRPGTPAAKMARIPANQVKLRTKRLYELFNSYEPYRGREGQYYTALVTEVSTDKKHYVGHNKFYEQILLPMETNLLGKSVQVKIIATTKFSMFGELVETEAQWKECSNKSVSHQMISSTYEDTNGQVTNDQLNNTKNPYIIYSIMLLVAAIVYRFVWKVMN